MVDKSRARSIQKSSPEREKQGQNKNRSYSDPSAQPEWLNQALETPSRARPEDILALQHRFGNQVVQRVLDSTVQRQPVTNEQGHLRQDIAAEIKAASQGGQSLSAPVRENMSQQLGHDFKNVRIHTGRKADTLSRELQARAFTLGNNIFFSQGAYDPQSEQGRHTLTHELTHVVQQSGGSGSGALKLGKPEDQYEKEADRVAANREAASKARLAAGAGVVQRFPSWKTIKSSLGFKSSDGSGSTTQTTQQGGTTNTAPQQPAEIIPTGLTAEIWKKMKSYGVTDSDTWTNFSGNRKTVIKEAVENNETKLAKLLIEGAKSNDWPKNSTGADLASMDVIKKILVSRSLKITDWNGIATERRRTILGCFTGDEEALGNELITASKNNHWPKDGADADIINKDKIKSIKDELKSSLTTWSKFTQGQRGVILTAHNSDPAKALELAKAAASKSWPKDGSDNDIANYTKWNEIKAAIPSITPKQWNSINAADRGIILSAPNVAEKAKLIKQSAYGNAKTDTKLEKIGEFAEHPVIEGLSGTAGTASSITGAMDNSKTSGIIGATADAGDTFLQGVSMLGAFSKYRRGKRMDKGALSSRAAQSLGKKQKREGIWGMAQGTLGLGGSISSLVGNISKGHNPDQDEEKGTSSVTDKVSGSFAIGAGALGSIKGGMGLFKSFRRSSKASKFVKENATGDEETLSNIASLTKKKQNRLGRFFETFKGVSTVLGGVSSIMGNDIFGSVMGGLGLAGGIGQAIATKAGEPKEDELNGRADDLVRLLGAGNADAIKFAKEVLNIKGVTDWPAWVNEDPEAVKELIKSKLSKH